MTDDSPTTPTPESFFRRKDDQSQDRGATTPGIEPGRVIGDFRLIRKLGEGGMGQVWKAKQITLNRSVALKLMPSAKVLSKARLAMFEREAHAGGRLNHPSIVSVLAYGEAGGIPHIAQELVGDGWSLKDSIQEAGLAHDLPDDWYTRIAVFFAVAADALQVAHDAGVIHRDLKPANILIASDDRPMIADFGLAKVSDVESVSRTGDQAGTYCYMSPEQALAKRVGLDHRSDVFSLGITLYEALTLLRPFTGDTPHQVTEAICWVEPDDPRSVRSKVPRDLAVICLKAMEKRRKDRYACMTDLAADLRRYLTNEPILGRPAGPLLKMSKWVRRHPTKSVALGLTAVALMTISLMALQLAARNTELTATVSGREAANAALNTANRTLAKEKLISDARRHEAEINAELTQEYAAAILYTFQRDHGLDPRVWTVQPYYQRGDAKPLAIDSLSTRELARRIHEGEFGGNDWAFQSFRFATDDRILKGAFPWDRHWVQLRDVSLFSTSLENSQGSR